ncbi:uvrD/REP helicase family protein [Janthinobacterium agaricidamnosum NBRC 102515 = DSM 9628]|uniref:DNA 3'-5' helicase n=1 Tax=Janthinobacterium agaricidamnosum NBRC 102515 = DSM 9628 TaxID=1349767 RepID=W0V486_9BURK|nr:uvrD/REP helicase family protein [Janthinobacterium agaricidamnosum NBRC 102515 = DSM 9628]
MQKQLYEGRGFQVAEHHVELARQLMFSKHDGVLKGPTSKQQEVIFSHSAAASVIAGAGSGKSTTLVNRVLFLKKYLEVPFENMSVFTFTRKSRKDFIEKLLEEAPRWNVALNEKKAAQIVRTFHSKALEMMRGLLRSDEGIFEFQGKAQPLAAKNNDMAATPADTDLSAIEDRANDIEGFVALDESAEQAEILKESYVKCYQYDENFRQAVATLFEYTIATPRLESENAKYQEKLSFLHNMSQRDADLCTHLEEKWTAQGSWPITGVASVTERGTRYPLSVMGAQFFANGYIAALDIYVVLGRYDGISIDVVGKTKLKPAYNVSDKRLILLTACPEKIRFINSAQDAAKLQTQLELHSIGPGLAAPSIDIRLPGEVSARPVFSALYNFGVFAENLGLAPQALVSQLAGNALGKAESASIYAVSKFFGQFYRDLEARNLLTFNQIFSRLGQGSADLAKVGAGALVGMKHLMIDEFQDISPLIVKFIHGLHGELHRKSDGGQKPTLMCVGDDWQSIYGWRGSSPHFFLNFPAFFPGATAQPILLQENFRSSQNIIDSGESFIRLVSKKSLKHGIASNSAVKALPFKVLSVEKFQAKDIEHALKAILQSMEPHEKVYLLASKHDELKPYDKLSDKKLTKTTFHQSKGLEADFVILVGAPKYFGANNLKNHLYSLARFPQTFDLAQQDEALRVAYVAATRAKKLCIWFAEPGSGSVMGKVAADGKCRQSMEVQAVVPYINECLNELRADNLIES